MFTATFIIDYLYFLALISQNVTTCFLKSFFFVLQPSFPLWDITTHFGSLYSKLPGINQRSTSQSILHQIVTSLAFRATTRSWMIQSFFGGVYFNFCLLSTTNILFRKASRLWDTRKIVIGNRLSSEVMKMRL